MHKSYDQQTRKGKKLIIACMADVIKGKERSREGENMIMFNVLIFSIPHEIVYVPLLYRRKAI